MNEPCAFGQKHHCPLWVDYIVALNSLEETEELCHGNWIEIERLRRWTDALTVLLDAHGISYPSEWDLDDCFCNDTDSDE